MVCAESERESGALAGDPFWTAERVSVDARNPPSSPVSVPYLGADSPKGTLDNRRGRTPVESLSLQRPFEQAFSAAERRCRVGLRRRCEPAPKSRGRECEPATPVGLSTAAAVPPLGCSPRARQVSASTQVPSLIVRPNTASLHKSRATDASIEPGLVALDPARTKPSVALRYEPGGRALGHRTVLALRRVQLLSSRQAALAATSWGVLRNREAPRFGLGAPRPHPTGKAVRSKARDAPGRAGGTSRRAGDTTMIVVDREVVADKPAGGKGFDDGAVVLLPSCSPGRHLACDESEQDNVAVGLLAEPSALGRDEDREASCTSPVRGRSGRAPPEPRDGGTGQVRLRDTCRFRARREHQRHAINCTPIVLTCNARQRAAFPC